MLVVVSMIGVTVGLTGVRAEDWPQWRGADRLGVWTEDRIVDSFPTAGLTVKWRVPISGGYAGPAVADASQMRRRFVADAWQMDSRS